MQNVKMAISSGDKESNPDTTKSVQFQSNSPGTRIPDDNSSDLLRLVSVRQRV